MRTTAILTALILTLAGPALAGDGMVVKKSPYPVVKTLDRLTAVLESKGITVFARVDHAAGAQKAGQSLPPTEVLIFGNPKLGTPLMTANRRIGLDLPMKALAWEDDTGQVRIGYLAPQDLAKRHGIENRADIIEKMTGALDKFTNAAVKAE